MSAILTPQEWEFALGAFILGDEAAVRAHDGALRALLEKVIDQGVANWHEVPNGEPALHSWLGLSWVEFAELMKA